MAAAVFCGCVSGVVCRVSCGCVKEAKRGEETLLCVALSLGRSRVVVCFVSGFQEVQGQGAHGA